MNLTDSMYFPLGAGAPPTSENEYSTLQHHEDLKKDEGDQTSSDSRTDSQYGKLNPQVFKLYGSVIVGICNVYAMRVFKFLPLILSKVSNQSMPK